MFHLPAAPFTRPIRLAVLISGGGTTLENFVAEIEAGRLAAEIAVVVASRPDCGGIEKSRRFGLRTEVVSRQEYADTAAFSAEVFAVCQAAEADLVLLGGFLSLLTIPDEFLGRVINIHPALIPSFCGAGYYGERVHQAVYERGVKLTGCTVHFADNQYDHGPIILQAAVPVIGGDTPHTIAQRVFAAECRLYPEAVRLYASAKLSLQSGRIHIHGETAETSW